MLQRSQPSVSNILYREIRQAESVFGGIKVLQSMGLNPDWFNLELLHELFLAVMGERKSQHRDVSNLGQLISNDCDPVSLLIIYDLYCRCGMYHYGYPYRELAQKRLLSSTVPSIISRNLSDKFLLTNLELSRYAEAETFLNHLDQGLEDNNVALGRDLREVAHFWAQEARVSANSSAINSEYWEFLKNKTIALVGPSEGLAGDGKEIDNHDIVVRLNYSFSGKGTDLNTKGTRTDITYFMREHCEAFIAEQNGLVPEEIKWAVVKDNQHLKKIKAQDYQRLKILEGDSLRQHTFNASLTAIPCVLTDLLKYPVAGVKIFHCDLFLTVMRAPGYTPNSVARHTLWQQKRDINKSFHDPATNFIFLQRLYENNRYKVDPPLGRVLKMNLDDYLREMQTIYDEKNHHHCEPDNP